VFKALPPNDDRNEQQTFSFYFLSELVSWFQRRVKQQMGAKTILMLVMIIL
jgi:hypothetical protein